MTAATFRQLALDLPAAIESSHMGHPDFRVAGKIFATLAPDETWAMVKLTPEQQIEFVQAKPQMFEPISGGWGRRGATKVLLKAATTAAVAAAVVAAWTNIAPQRLLDQLDDA